MRYPDRMVAAVKPAELRDHLVEQNRYFASSDDLCELLGVQPESLYGSLHRPSERGEIVNVCPGGWVAVPARVQNLPHPMPPPTWYLDAMMGHLGHPYYAGFCEAARYWGAEHHMSFVTTVVTSARSSHRTDRQLRRTHPEALKKGAVRMRYVHCRDPESKSLYTREYGDGGAHPMGTKVVYSTPETTVLDAVERPEFSMGLDNVSNIACGFLLWGCLSPDALAADALNYPVSVRQRTGAILEKSVEHMGIPFDLAPLKETLPSRLNRVPLFKEFEAWFPPLYSVPDPLPVDRTWNVIGNGLLAPEV